MASSVVDLIAQAIATGEGFYSPCSVPARANNPGDLQTGCNWQGENGTITAQGGKILATFDNTADGWRALKKDIANHIAANGGQSLRDFIKSYAGNTNYLGLVMKALGISDPNATLGSLNPPTNASCCGNNNCGGCSNA